MNLILLEFYTWMWHWKLVHCIEGKSYRIVITPHLLRLFRVFSTVIHFFLICISFSSFFFFSQMKFHIILSLRKPSNWLFKEEPFMDMRTWTPGELKNKSPEKNLNSVHLWRNADIIYFLKRLFCADQKVEEVESFLTTECFPFIVVSVISWQRLIYKASGP